MLNKMEKNKNWIRRNGLKIFISLMIIKDILVAFGCLYISFTINNNWMTFLGIAHVVTLVIFINLLIQEYKLYEAKELK